MYINLSCFSNRLTQKLLALLSIIALTCLPQSFASSQTNDRQVSEDVATVISQTNELMSDENYQASLKSLKSLLQKTDLSPYERAIILQIKGKIHYELKQTKFALEAFEKAVASGDLLLSEANQLRLDIAQLHIGEENYVTGAKMLEQWERSGNTLKPNHIALLIQAWVVSNNHHRALPWAEKWFETADPKQRKHYNLVNFFYSHLGLTVRQSILHDEMKAR